MNTDALKGLTATKKCGSKLRFHVIIVSCISHIREEKNCLSVKHRVLVSSLSTTIFLKENLSDLNVYPFRNISDTERFSKRNSAAEKLELLPQLVNPLSSYLVKPMFFDCPFMRSEFSNNIYSIFSFEERHNFFLGISRMLKTCALERPCDHTLSMIAMSLKDSPKQFSIV